jgi:hypothetical protein
MTRSRVVLVLVTICASTSQTTWAQQDYGAPEAMAAEVLRADSMHDWRLLLALTHPDALREYRQDQVRMFRLDLFPRFPGMDSCSIRQLHQYHRFLLDSVFRAASPEIISQLPSDTVFARVQRYLARYHGPRAEIDSFAPARVILGHVLADDSTAYVVLEERYQHRPFPDWPERRAEIMTFRQYQHSWRTMLDPNLGHGVENVMFGREGCP